MHLRYIRIDTQKNTYVWRLRLVKRLSVVSTCVCAYVTYMYTYIKKKHKDIALTACQLSVGLVSIGVCGNICGGSIAAYIHTQWKICVKIDEP